jgi:ankyrin repeat protein
MGQTAMHVAALWGNLEAIKVLIANGADVNHTNSRCECLYDL